jgi:hypothetical protein
LDHTIAPGQSEEVKVTMTISSRRSGPFTRSVSVTTNDADHHKTALTCAGTMLVPFKMEPTSVVFGHLVRSDGPQKKTITITRGDGGPLAPELMPVGNPNVEALLREIEPGEKYELDIKVTPDWPRRSLNTNLVLKTGVAEAPEEKIRVYASLAPRLRVVPVRFQVPESVPEERDLRARLVWSKNKPAQILEVTSSDPSTTVRIEEQNNWQQVILHIPAGYKPPLRPRPVVTLKTDDPEVPKMEIEVWQAPKRRASPTLTGAGRVPPRLATRPAFGIRPGRPTSRPAFGPRPGRATSRPAFGIRPRRPTSRPAFGIRPARPTSRPAVPPKPGGSED